MKRIVVALLACLHLLTACDVFIEKKNADALKEYEKKIYALKKDVDVEGRKLKKGDDVKIVVTVGKDWVKVHAFPARENDLKAERILILYLFDDDFDKKKFNAGVFNDQLLAVVTPRGDKSLLEKNEKKVKKNYK